MALRTTCEADELYFAIEHSFNSIVTRVNTGSVRVRTPSRTLCGFGEHEPVRVGLTGEGYALTLREDFRVDVSTW